ncbi:MAG: hypothetical protein QOJ81_1529 [Chloroflexota bacterium]|jgi:hypothetical protein|nr:hypothetical protein [Chloroflexota bacterium]
MRRDLAFPIHIPGEDDRDYGVRSALRELRARPKVRVLIDALVGVWVIGWVIAGLLLFFAIGSVQ